MGYDYKLTAVLNTNHQPVKFRVGGKDHFQIFLGIGSKADPDLAKISSVEYLLHPTFKSRVKTSKNRLNNFQIELLAWGTFEVGITLRLNDETDYEFKQNMSEVLKKKAL